MIAGFEQPDEGEILLDGQPVERVPPYRRNVNMVFQSYALFEHLSIADNVAFGLKRKRVAKARDHGAGSARCSSWSASPTAAKATPRQLSGGQQQRVALARALVNLPALLLLDEPLGALDLKLRKQMQIELKQIQREVGITFVYVTHDQEEALTMSDRIAVMNDGVLQQVGSARGGLRAARRTRSSPQFIGISNLLAGDAEAGGVRLADGPVVPLDAARRRRRRVPRCTVSVRPEKLSLESWRRTRRHPATVVESVYMGTVTHHVLAAESGTRLIVIAQNTDVATGAERLAVGSRTTAWFRPAHARALAS